MVRRAALYITFLMALITAGALNITPHVEGQGKTLGISVDTPSITINASKEGDPNSFFVEKDLTFTVAGDMKDPANSSNNAIAYVTMGSPVGVLAMVLDDNPTKSGRIPFQTTIRLGIYKSSPVGTGSVEFSASSNGVVRTVNIPVKITKESISVKLISPTQNQVMSHPSLEFRGNVTPAIQGAEVCLEIYHHKPNLTTTEQQFGQGSGIVVAGFTLTDSTGRFVLDEDHLAFYNPLGLLASSKMVNITGLPDGNYWLMYYVTGRVLQPNLYEKSNIRNLTDVDIGSANEIYQPLETPDPTSNVFERQLVQFTVNAASQSLTVKCTNSEGSAMTGAEVASTLQPSGQIALKGTTGSDDSVTFQKLVPGDYTFKAFQLSFDSFGSRHEYDANASVTIVSGQAKSLVLVLKEVAYSNTNVPGFPLESIILGIVAASWLIWRTQRGSKIKEHAAGAESVLNKTHMRG